LGGEKRKINSRIIDYNNVVLIRQASICIGQNITLW